MISYETVGTELGKLVAEKQKAYGDSVGATEELLKLLYPDGVLPESYGDLHLIIRVFDKLKRIATDKHALGESPWEDIAGYALLAIGAQMKKDGKDVTG